MLVIYIDYEIVSVFEKCILSNYFKSHVDYYTRAVYFRQAHFEICPFRACYSKSTVENFKSFGAVRIGYVRYDISKDLAKNLFFWLVIPTSLNPSL